MQIVKNGHLIQNGQLPVRSSILILQGVLFVIKRHVPVDFCTFRSIGVPGGTIWVSVSNQNQKIDVTLLCFGFMTNSKSPSWRTVMVQEALH